VKIVFTESFLVFEIFCLYHKLSSRSYLYVQLSKHILDYRKKQARTLRISENIIFTKDDIMSYDIGALQ